MLQAVKVIYPQSQLQRSFVHQIRNSTKFVRYTVKKVVTDLEKIYTAMTLQEVESNLAVFSKNSANSIFPVC